MNRDRIDYLVTFYSYWHCGSGLAAGADADALVIKNQDGLPFIPGRTLKGLIRQAAEEISDTQDLEVFGLPGGHPSPLFFTDAILVDERSIIENHLEYYLFDAISNTQIDENGIAQNGSLRRTEVTIPCTLKGAITGIPSDDVRDMIIKSMPYIKHIGAHRTRGLGRCSITILEGK